METIVQITGVALIVACLGVVLRGRADVLSLMLSLAGCVMILLMSVKLFQPVLELVHRLEQLTGLETPVTAPVTKVLGICMLTKIASSVCEDSGDRALGQALEIGGNILALYCALPLLSAVLDLLQEILEGAG